MITRAFSLTTLATLLLTIAVSRSASSLPQRPQSVGFIITNVRVFDGESVHERM